MWSLGSSLISCLEFNLLFILLFLLASLCLMLLASAYSSNAFDCPKLTCLFEKEYKDIILCSIHAFRNLAGWRRRQPRVWGPIRKAVMIYSLINQALATSLQYGLGRVALNKELMRVTWDHHLKVHYSKENWILLIENRDTAGPLFVIIQ